ncbi:hypothetical protein [Streptomyces sp. ITFR-16]|nr:hypothetical protein [Streptomyces sp. ITFR-16]WNI20775.1 hypothetical protein RLT58_02070 [Streptomyces sp. ITFR-16]
MACKAPTGIRMINTCDRPSGRRLLPSAEHAVAAQSSSDPEADPGKD